MEQKFLTSGLHSRSNYCSQKKKTVSVKYKSLPTSTEAKQRKTSATKLDDLTLINTSILLYICMHCIRGANAYYLSVYILKTRYINLYMYLFCVHVYACVHTCRCVHVLLQCVCSIRGQLMRSTTWVWRMDLKLATSTFIC